MDFRYKILMMLMMVVAIGGIGYASNIRTSDGSDVSVGSNLDLGGNNITNIYSLTIDRTTGNPFEHAIEVVYRDNVTDASALSISSLNRDNSAVWISGYETSRGTVKIQHNGNTTTSDASALSIKLNGTNTDAQGIFIDTSSGATGDFLNIRNNGIQKFTLQNDGDIYTYGVVYLNDTLDLNQFNIIDANNIGYSTTQARFKFFSGAINLKNVNSFGLETANITSTGDVRIGDGVSQKNITMTSPDGTEYSCGVANGGSFSCS